MEAFFILGVVVLVLLSLYTLLPKDLLMEHGYVYVLRNDSLKNGLFKIGFIETSLEEYNKKVTKKGLPTPYVTCMKYKSKNPKRLEKELKDKFLSKRSPLNKDFFNMSKEDLSDLKKFLDNYNDSELQPNVDTYS